MGLKVDSAHDLLVLDSRPVVLAIILGGMILVLAGAGISVAAEGATGTGLAVSVGEYAFLSIFLVVFVRRNQLVLDRRNGRILHRRRSLLGYSEQALDLSDLHEAIVRESRSGDGTTYRMELRMRDGHHPFTSSYSSGHGARRAAKAVNRWLEDGAPSPGPEARQPPRPHPRHHDAPFR